VFDLIFELLVRTDLFRAKLVAAGLTF